MFIFQKPNFDWMSKLIQTFSPSEAVFSLNFYSLFNMFTLGSCIFIECLSYFTHFFARKLYFHWMSKPFYIFWAFGTKSLLWLGTPPGILGPDGPPNLARRNLKFSFPLRLLSFGRPLGHLARPWTPFLGSLEAICSWNVLVILHIFKLGTCIFIECLNYFQNLHVQKLYFDWMSRLISTCSHSEAPFLLNVTVSFNNYTFRSCILIEWLN